jgi:hypothetical protein
LLVAAKRKVDPSQCRVRLDPNAAHLPRLWNYRVEVPADVAPAGDAAPGEVWFQVLFENEQQSAERIATELRRHVAAHGADADALLRAVSQSPTFQIAQVLWRPRAEGTMTVSAEIGLSAVRLGVRLLAHPSEDLARAAAEAAALASRARQAVFLDPPRLEQELGELLRELIADPDWLDSIAAPRPVAPPPPAPVVAPARVSAPPPPAEAEAMEATVIIKRGGAPAAAVGVTPPPRTPTKVEPPPAAAGEMDQTIIVSKKGAVPAAPPRPVVPAATPPPAPESENLDATIIISKDKKR